MPIILVHGIRGISLSANYGKFVGRKGTVLQWYINAASINAIVLVRYMMRDLPRIWDISYTNVYSKERKG